MPINLKGSRISHTTGYKISARIASGQQRKRRINHRINVFISTQNLIFFIDENRTNIKY
jgi:hypothetical protein